MGIYIGIGNTIGHGLRSRNWTPRNFNVVLDNPDGVDRQDAIITWTATAFEVEIWRSLDGAAFALLTTIAPNIGTYTDHLMDGVNHTVEYYARFKQDTTVLNVPTGLTLTQIAGGVRIAFIGNNTEQDTYEYWGKLNSGSYTLIHSANAVSYDYTLGLGTSLTVKIRAKEGTLPVYSGYSTEQTISLAVTDRDGNIYTVITVAGKRLLLENWKSTKFNDGSPISLVTTGAGLTALWGTTTNSSMSYYAGNAANKAIYGGLYSHGAIRDAKGFCPAGLRIPTDTEWADIITALEGATLAGGHLKEDGTTHWTADNADNTSGFTALGGGIGSNDDWYYTKTQAQFWSFDWAGAYANSLTILGSNTAATRVSQTYRSEHLSVRLILD